MFLTRRRPLCLWKILLLCVCLRARSVVTEKTYFPTDVNICSAKDPNLNTCFTDSANRMLKHLTGGLRKLNAVPMEPLNVPRMSIGRGNSLIPKLAFNYTDTIHTGWKDAVVLRSKINPKDREFDIVLKIPEYGVRGLYEISGSVADIPLEGSGNFNASFINMTNYIFMRGHLERRRTQEFLVIDDLRQKTHIDKMKINFNNLFNNTQLSDATNALLNQNDRAVLDEATDAISEVLGEILVVLAQRIFNRVPYKAMFTDLD